MAKSAAVLLALSTPAMGTGDWNNSLEELSRVSLRGRGLSGIPTGTNPTQFSCSGNCFYDPKCCGQGQTCFEKKYGFASCKSECAPGIHADDPPKYQTAWTCAKVKPLPPPVPAPPPNPLNLEPSTADVFTFYMYRSTGPEGYGLENTNTGNLAGVLWYLQNEIVSGVYEESTKKVDRIRRYKVQMRPTKALAEKNMHFGVRVAFDSRQCTGPDCEFDWATYGYNVGCNKLGDWPFPEFDTLYPDPVWYSLPGKCPTKTYAMKTASCDSEEPGGMCQGRPTGTGSCTWSYEDAGHLSLDEIYEGESPRDFFAAPKDPKANRARVARAQSAFTERYGEDLPAPPCDFNRDAFYKH